MIESRPCTVCGESIAWHMFTGKFHKVKQNASGQTIWQEPHIHLKSEAELIEVTKELITKYATKYPLIPAKKTKDGVHLYFKCSKCKRNHHHGGFAVDDNPYGHRMAHCHRPKGYGSYVLVPWVGRELVEQDGYRT